jgi:predicted DNA-binding transcriptional regulator YafY
MPSPSSRLLSLLSLLQTRRDWPGAVLADRLDVSPRTVRRDVDRLRELGYPIASAKGPDGGYRLRAGSELPPLLFDDDQAVAVAVALQTATTAGTGIEEGAVRALGIVRQVMPSRLRRRVDAIRVQALEPAGGEAGPQVATSTLVAIGEKRTKYSYDVFDRRCGARRCRGCRAGRRVRSGCRPRRTGSA